MDYNVVALITVLRSLLRKRGSRGGLRLCTKMAQQLESSSERLHLERHVAETKSSSEVESTSHHSGAQAWSLGGQ